MRFSRRRTVHMVMPAISAQRACSSPHPFPLPWGEGEPSPVSRRMGALELFGSQTPRLPLPKGQGRGEGNGPCDSTCLTSEMARVYGPARTSGLRQRDRDASLVLWAGWCPALRAYWC